jgi:NitT/TauT family transport system ATP-binding protein
MAIAPLPSASISKILGLCEVLDDHGGKEELDRIGRDLHLPIGELLLVLRGAEILGLIELTHGIATLEEAGARVHRAPMAEKKAMLKQQMLKLALFSHVIRLLQASESHTLPADVLLERLAVLLPQEEPRVLFTTLLNWGRYGEVFGYSHENDALLLV